MFAINKENFEILIYHMFLKYIKSFYCLQYCGHEYEKIFTDEELIERIKVVGL